jgi:hypothetical protein
MSISVWKQSLQIAKRSLSNFYENSVVSFLIEILRHSNALSTPFYTPNAVHVDFSIETIPANRKTQSIKFLRNLCHFVPDWDTTAYKRSFHSIQLAERIACRFQCRDNPCKSQNAIFQISRNLCHFVPDWGTTAFKRSFHFILHAECSACRFQCRKNPCISQNAIFQISTKSLSFSLSYEILRRS